jgi:NDP-sugar pyrophosphorylase family protein
VEEVEALVLAGGRGTRLRSVVSSVPKPLALVDGRPFVDFLLDALLTQGVDQIVLATGHLGEVYHQHLPRWSAMGLRVRLSQEEDPLGTAGALRRAVPLLDSDRILVLNGDSICRFEIDRLPPPPSLWLLSVDDTSRYGSVELAPDGAVLAFREKAAGGGAGLVNAGVYLFDRREVESIPPDRPVSIERELLPGLVGRGLRGVVGDGPLIDIGTPESYAAAAAALGDLARKSHTSFGGNGDRRTRAR